MKNIYFFTGDNKYLIDERIGKIIEKEKLDEFGVVKYDSEEVTLDEVLDDCETLPFLNDKKLVIVNQTFFLSTEKSAIEHNIERLISYINNPNDTTILIINAFGIKIDKRNKLYKLLITSENVQAEEFASLTEEEAEKLIKDYFHLLNCEITNIAVKELIKRCECDALRIHSELKKISFYVEDKKEITLEDIDLLVCEVLESNIFNLINSILDRKISDALKIYHQLLIINEEPIVFSSILGKSFHNLYIIKQYQKQSFTEYQLRNILKIHPYQLKILYRLANQTSEDMIIKNIHNLHKYDVMVKSGRIDKYLGFEMIILNM